MTPSLLLGLSSCCYPPLPPTSCPPLKALKCWMRATNNVSPAAQVVGETPSVHVLHPAIQFVGLLLKIKTQDYGGGVD